MLHLMIFEHTLCGKSSVARFTRKLLRMLAVVPVEYSFWLFSESALVAFKSDPVTLSLMFQPQNAAFEHNIAQLAFCRRHISVDENLSTTVISGSTTIVVFSTSSLMIFPLCFRCRYKLASTTSIVKRRNVWFHFQLFIQSQQLHRTLFNSKRIVFVSSRWQNQLELHGRLSLDVHQFHFESLRSLKLSAKLAESFIRNKNLGTCCDSGVLKRTEAMFSVTRWMKTLGKHWAPKGRTFSILSLSSIKEAQERTQNVKDSPISTDVLFSKVASLFNWAEKLSETSYKL